MAKHIVKCAICGQEFDTQLIQAVKHGARRYSHASCEPDNKDFVPLGQEADPDLIKLKDYISKLFKTPNWSMINKQIKKYKEEQGYSYSGILKSLVYFFEIKNNPIDKANNAIGIVPFVYQDAYNYYLSLFMAQQGTQDKTLVAREETIIIKPPHKRGTKFKLFHLGADNDEV